MIIVIDSNIWISALVFGGNPRRIFEQTVSKGWRIAVSEEIYTEIRRILQQKFPEFVQDLEDLIQVLQPNVYMVRLGSQEVELSRDKDDNKIIETALIAKAHYVISGDKDLLVLRNYKNIQFLTPKQFIDEAIE
jgi:putative PIN family toxin of toxin-antitoxin system